MPSKHIIKTYIEDGYYHVYNRGVEKRAIFLDDQDYRVFLHLLKTYLSPPPPPEKQHTHPLTKVAGFTPARLRPFFKSLHEEVKLLAYCLMPNHFHLLLHQKTRQGMTKLLRRLCTTYSLYFNRRYKRVGPLFQGRYKAALVNEDFYLLHLSRYLHLQPRELTRTDLVKYPYSTYQYYLGLKEAAWVRPEKILAFFKKAKEGFPPDILTYRKFVEGYPQDPCEAVGTLALEQP